MTTTDRSVSPERFVEGRTFTDYLDYIGTPENLVREANNGPRPDHSVALRGRYDRTTLTEAQSDAIRVLAARPDGPAKILMIAEEWSSDCRRDLPYVARLAEAGGLELRIFNRDGERYSTAHVADPNESPNADLMARFLLTRGEQTFQAIPIVAFYTRDFDYLWHYTEYPACYHKDRLAEHRLTPHEGETEAQTVERSNREFAAMIESPMYDVWATAGVSEMLAALFERLTIGS
jgi:hypothetical protein